MVKKVNLSLCKVRGGWTREGGGIGAKVEGASSLLLIGLSEKEPPRLPEPFRACEHGNLGGVTCTK